MAFLQHRGGWQVATFKCITFYLDNMTNIKRRKGNAQATESTLSIFITVLLIPQTCWPYQPLQHYSIMNLSADREKWKSWDVYDLSLMNLQSNSLHVASHRWWPEFALLNTMIKQDEPPPRLSATPTILWAVQVAKWRIDATRWQYLFRTAIY